MYISRSEARRAVLKEYPTIAHCISSVKSANVEPVVHASWEYNPGRYQFHCSECGWFDGNRYYGLDSRKIDFNSYYIDLKGFRRCPNCGAHMNDGQENDK